MARGMERSRIAVAACLFGGRSRYKGPMRKSPLLAGLLLATAASAQSTPAADEQGLGRTSGLVLGIAGGVVAPFAVLGVGGRGEARVSWLLAHAPLGFSLSFGVEQHTATTTAFFPPPAGGFERAGIDNQTLYPAQSLVHLLLVRDERNRLQLGAGYALLLTWSQTQALGKQSEESGVGHELGAELAFARRFGSFELELRARYSVRRTAVGSATTAMELPWYQTAGLLFGVGLWP